jgi:hypothetical protein
VLTDEYLDAQHLSPRILYRIADTIRFDLGQFNSLPELIRETRCDLHPRRSRDGNSTCFDSNHSK